MLSLADELSRGPKLAANPEITIQARARDMYYRGYTRKAIAKELKVNHATVTKWINNVKRGNKVSSQDSPK